MKRVLAPLRAVSALLRAADVPVRHRLGLLRYFWQSSRIQGWTRDAEAAALALASYRLSPDAVVVEIGSYLGSSAVLLAGARTLRGSGTVHCIDPFDASGDEYSAAFYEEARREVGGALRAAFDRNVAAAGVSSHVVVHQGTAEEVLPQWSTPIDLLFLDGHQSYHVVRPTHDGWSRHLKTGGVLALHNSAPSDFPAGHDGHYRVVAELVRPPVYTDVRLVGTTTFARKAPDAGAPGGG